MDTNTKNKKIKFWNRLGFIAPIVVSIPFIYTVCSTMRPVINNPYLSTPEVVQVRKIDENLAALQYFKQSASSTNISFEYDNPTLANAANDLLASQDQILASCSNLESKLNAEKEALSKTENCKGLQSTIDLTNKRLRDFNYLLPFTLIAATLLVSLSGYKVTRYERQK